MSLEKIKGRYYPVAGNCIGDAYSLEEIGENILYHAISAALNGDLKGLTVTDLLKSEWGTVAIPQKDIEKISQAYRATAMKCVIHILEHVECVGLKSVKHESIPT